MPAYPTTDHSYDSNAKPVVNTITETLESGAQHNYVTSDTDWYDVDYIVPVYYDRLGLMADHLEAFYKTNRLAENITFECKGYKYIGLMTTTPQTEQLPGFGMWRITQKFRAQRTGKINELPSYTGSYLLWYLEHRGPI